MLIFPIWIIFSSSLSVSSVFDPREPGMDVGFLFFHSYGKKAPLFYSICNGKFLWELKHGDLGLQSTCVAAAGSDAVIRMVCGVPLPQGV